jgi:transposase
VSVVEPPSYEQLALFVVELTGRLYEATTRLDEATVRLDEANARIAALEAEVAALRAQVGKDSTNSSTPPSADAPAAKAKRKAVTSQRVRSKDRRRGGQPGRPGSGLTPTQDPDDTREVEAAAECSGCGADLVEHGSDVRATWAQVWDIKPVELEKVHYVLPKRRCGCCGKLTTASVPFASAGSVSYGPNVNAAAILLSSQGNVPVEATARLMAALLGVPVSTGFVARAHERFADLLAAGGFDQAMIAALRAEAVLCADETPVNVVDNIDPDGQPAAGSPHVVTVRTPDEKLVWYKEIAARTSQRIAALGIFDNWHGILVRDDYAGWHQFDATLAGVQQCAAHLVRHLQGVLDLDPEVQQWAGQVQEALRDAARLVDTANRTGKQIDADALADARWRYDQGVLVGISLNLSRPWHKGNHPGLVQAKRLQDKADQVWLFTKDTRVPWTNNSSEQALKSPKLHQKVSGYWQSTLTLARYCRVRSYLVTARNHGIKAIDAIHAALVGRPWLPSPAIS